MVFFACMQTKMTILPEEEAVRVLDTAIASKDLTKLQDAIARAIHLLEKAGKIIYANLPADEEINLYHGIWWVDDHRTCEAAFALCTA